MPEHQSNLRSKWTLGEARRLLKQVEEQVSKVGWHVGLAGGVLRRGRSSKDVDMLVFPHHAPIVDGDLKRLWKALRAVGMTRYRSVYQMHRFWEAKAEHGQSADAKFVEVWQTAEGKRVDVIVLS